MDLLYVLYLTDYSDCRVMSIVCETAAEGIIGEADSALRSEASDSNAARTLGRLMTGIAGLRI